jgi:hypothetical protein
MDSETLVEWMRRQEEWRTKLEDELWRIRKEQASARSKLAATETTARVASVAVVAMIVVLLVEKLIG